MNEIKTVYRAFCSLYHDTVFYSIMLTQNFSKNILLYIIENINRALKIKKNNIPILYQRERYFIQKKYIILRFFVSFSLS